MADQSFTGSAAIDIRRINEVNSVIQRELNHFIGGALVEIAHVHAAPELHCAQRYGADNKT